MILFDLPVATGVLAVEHGVAGGQWWLDEGQSIGTTTTYPQKPQPTPTPTPTPTPK